MAARGSTSVLSLALAWACAACGGSPDIYQVEFGADITKARVRSLEALVFKGVECKNVFAVEHRPSKQLGSLIAEVKTNYPVVRDEEPFKELPRGEPLTIVVGYFDSNNELVGRSCDQVTLEISTYSEVTFNYHSIPPCPATPAALDIALIFEASTDMTFANSALGQAVLDLTATHFSDMGNYPPDSRFSLFVHGPGTTEARLKRASETDALSDGILALKGSFSGQADLFTAVTLAGRHLRSQASCARLPVLLAISAGSSPSGVGEAAFAAEAAHALYGTQGIESDDIYSVGIGLSDVAQEDLFKAIPEGLGSIEGAKSQSSYRAAVSNARFRFRNLVIAN